MPPSVIYLADVQDLWLYNAFKLNDALCIYATSGKVTSPHLFVGQLNDRFRSTMSHEALKSNGTFERLIRDLGDIRFITKECLPFTGVNEFSDRIFSIGWVGESIETNSPYKIDGACAHHFIESQYHRAYVHRGSRCNFHFEHPKYYFLNAISDRKTACQILGLDDGLRYVTVFNSVMTDLTKQQRRAFDFLLRYSEKNGLRILLKNKMKHSSRPSLDAFKTFLGSNIDYHQGLLLQVVSEFSMSLPSNSAVEAENLGTKFVAFWGHDDLPENELLDDILKQGRAYRLAKEGVFRVLKDRDCDENDLMRYLESDRSFQFGKKYPISHLLLDVVNDKFL